MGRLLMAAALLALPLAGCAALPMAISATGGALSIAKNGFDLDVSVRQFLAVKRGEPLPPALACPAPIPPTVETNLSLDGN